MARPGNWITPLDIAGGQSLSAPMVAAEQRYKSAYDLFREFCETGGSPVNLWRRIHKQDPSTKAILLRLFRMVICDGRISVEWLKRSNDGTAEQIRKTCSKSVSEDRIIDVLSDPKYFIWCISKLDEHQSSGQKGYVLTKCLFDWFESSSLHKRFRLSGPRSAGRDILLNECLPDFDQRVPADFVLDQKINGLYVPRLVGFARYDTDRGGSQENDRINSNKSHAECLLNWNKQADTPVKVLFLNDGPGLLFPKMKAGYEQIDTLHDQVRVSTLKMLPHRLRSTWIRSA